MFINHIKATGKRIIGIAKAIATYIIICLFLLMIEVYLYIVCFISIKIRKKGR